MRYHKAESSSAFHKMEFGLKQTRRAWYQDLLDLLMRLVRRLDFDKIEGDHGLFASADETVLISVYADDLPLSGTDIEHRIDDVEQIIIRDRFSIIDLGDVSHYFGSELNVELKLNNLPSLSPPY